MQLWSNKSWHEENIVAFREFLRRNPQLDFYFPNFRDAPWHLQARTQDGEVLDFWPHKNKGCYNGLVRSGISGLEWLVGQAEMLGGGDVLEDF